MSGHMVAAQRSPDGSTKANLRSEVCDEALSEIAAFETFISDFVTRQSNNGSDISGTASSKNCCLMVAAAAASPKSSTGSSSSGCRNKFVEHENNNNSYRNSAAPGGGSGNYSKTLSKEDLKTKRLLVTSSRMVRTLERQKKIVVSPQASEEGLLP